MMFPKSLKILINFPIETSFESTIIKNWTSCAFRSIWNQSGPCQSLKLINLSYLFWLHNLKNTRNTSWMFLWNRKSGCWKRLVIPPIILSNASKYEIDTNLLLVGVLVWLSSIIKVSCKLTLQGNYWFIHTASMYFIRRNFREDNNLRDFKFIMD